MKSLRQTFALVVIALAAYGVYSFIFLKKPVDNTIPDELVQELAQEGISINSTTGVDGKSALFDNLLGAPPITAHSVPASSSVPTVISGMSPIAPQSVTPAPPFAQSVDLDDAPLFNKTSAPPHHLNQNTSHDSSPVHHPPNLLQNAPLIQPPPLPMDFPEDFPEDFSSDFSGDMPNELPRELPLPPPDDSMPDSMPGLSRQETTTPQSVQEPVSTLSQQAVDSDDVGTGVAATTETFVATAVSSSLDSADPFTSPSSGPSKYSNLSDPFFNPVTPETSFVPAEHSGCPESNQQLRDCTAPIQTVTHFVQPLPAVEETQPTVPRPSSLLSKDSVVIPLPPITEPTESFIPISAVQPIQQPVPQPIQQPVQQPIQQSVSQPVQQPILEEGVRAEFMQSLAEIRHILNNGDYREGHRRITELYHEELSPAERKHLLPTLDKCGWAAFFSRSYFPLNPAYKVGPNDTIESMAASFQVTPELIRKINGLSPGVVLQVGQELKIPRGPFYASISLSQHELVLYSEDLYACRFRIGIGESEMIRETKYKVEDKFRNPRYIGENGEVESGDPANPLGTRWIGLDGPLGIHGTNDTRWIGNNRSPVEGFCLDNKDIEEVYDMLVAPAAITIRR